MNRRAVLGSGLALSGTLLAGCNALPFVGDSADGGDDSRSEYAFFVSLFNTTSADHEVDLRVTTQYTGEERTLSYDLAPRSAREHVTLSQAPARVAVRVDGDPAMDGEWPSVDSCREQNSAGKPGLEVKLLTGAGTDGLRVETYWDCQAVTPPENR